MDIDALNKLDQALTLYINGSESVFWDDVMITVTDTLSWSLVIVVLLYILFKNCTFKEFLLTVLVMGLLIFVADRICSGWVKPTVARWRPTQDPLIMYLIDTVRDYRGGRYGFFSGHSCNTFCMATFLSLLFRSKRVSLTLFFWAATTTFTRLYLGVHYLGDVTVGFVVGITLGTIFYFIHYYIKKKMNTVKLISEQFTPSGFLRCDMDMFLTVVFFTYICVVVVSMIRGV